MSNEAPSQPQAEDAQRPSEAEYNELLSVSGFEALANRICMHTPEDCVISVRFESGAAWVELRRDRHTEDTPLPDSADKDLLEQVHDALLVANGWDT